MAFERVAAATSELRLSPAEATYSGIDGDREVRVVVPFLDYVIDGTSLRELVRAAGSGGDYVTGLCRAWPAAVTTTTVEALLGGGTDHSADVEILVCPVCGDRGCGALLADVTVAGDHVTWHDWRFVDANGTVALDDLCGYAFDRHAYENEVQAAPAAVAGLPSDGEGNRPRRFLWPWRWGWRLPPGR